MVCFSSEGNQSKLTCLIYSTKIHQQLCHLWILHFVQIRVHPPISDTWGHWGELVPLICISWLCNCFPPPLWHLTSTLTFTTSAFMWTISFITREPQRVLRGLWEQDTHEQHPNLISSHKSPVHSLYLHLSRHIFSFHKRHWYPNEANSVLHWAVSLTWVDNAQCVLPWPKDSEIAGGDSICHMCWSSAFLFSIIYYVVYVSYNCTMLIMCCFNREQY